MLDKPDNDFEIESKYTLDFVPFSSIPRVLSLEFQDALC
jgi:hypothetical protein